MRPSFAQLTRAARRAQRKPPIHPLAVCQRDVIVSTLKEGSKGLTFPNEAGVKALGLRFDHHDGVSNGFQEFLNRDVPRLKYANPQIPIRAFRLSPQPYPPPGDQEPKRIPEFKSDHMAPASASASAAASSDPSSSIPSSSSAAAAAAASSSSAPTSSDPRTTPESSAAAAAAAAAKPTEYPVDPNDLDAEVWRRRFRQFKDRGKLAPSEVVIEYFDKPPKIIPFNGARGTTLTENLIQTIRDGETLLEGMVLPDSEVIMPREDMLSIGAAQAAEAAAAAAEEAGVDVDVETELEGRTVGGGAAAVA